MAEGTGRRLTSGPYLNQDPIHDTIIIMVDNGPSYAEMGVTKTEAFQADRRMVNPAVETKASQTLLTQRPDLQKALSTDPFSEETQKLTHLEQGKNFRSALRAAIMAEPPGEYEKQFASLSREEQKAKLYEQIDASADMTLRTERYVEEHLTEIAGQSDTELYKTLVKTAFQTDNPQEIEANFAQSQRRGYRLGIANFLETREAMAKYKAEAGINPKGLAEQLFGSSIAGEVTMEHLPVGLVVYLDEKDYKAVVVANGGPQSTPSNGMVVKWSALLPDELKGKVIVMNKGGESSPVRTKKQLADTRKHEVRHILFTQFHSFQQETSAEKLMREVTACKTRDEFSRFADTLYQDFAEQAKDEIAAYLSTGRLDTNFSNTRFSYYNGYLNFVGGNLRTRQDISGEDKQAVFETFNSNRELCYDAIRQMRLVAENMYRRSEVGLIDRDKAVALLMNTPATKVHRLARYTDWTEEDIRSERVIKQRDQDAEKSLQDLLRVPDHHDKHWEADAKRVTDYLKSDLPPQSMLTLSKAVAAWTEKDWSYSWGKKSLEIAKDYIVAHGLPEDAMYAMRTSLNIILGDEALKGKHSEMKKTAEELLAFIGQNTFDFQAPTLNSTTSPSRIT